MKQIFFVPFILLMLLASCGEEENGQILLEHPLHLNKGQSSKDPVTRVVVSESKPKKGQKHRSSDNFSTKGMNSGTHLLWCVEEGISFDIMVDKTAASDPTCATSVTNGFLTPFTGYFKDASNLYIANPKGASGNFELSYTVVDENSDDVYVSVASGHADGQKHRASSNFTLKAGRYVVDCPEGISFSIMEDKSAAEDNKLAIDLTSGRDIDRPQATNIYIADTKGATGPFIITFRYAPLVWMDKVNGSSYLYELSIPGTHDSSTWLASPGFAKCQNYNFKCQLDQGIRYFDMRVNGNLKLCHGTSTYNYTLDEAVDDFKKWLEANPTETIMMQVKDEHDSDEVPGKVKSLLLKKEVNEIVFRENRVPKLDEVRGKIVLLRRHKLPKETSADTLGIDLSNGWPEDGCGALDNGVPTYIEDRFFSASTWVHDTNKKASDIRETFDRANGISSQSDVDYSRYLFLTFNSIACRPEEGKTPWDYAWGGLGDVINPYMCEAMNDILKEGDSKYRRTGVVLFDFYNRHGLDDPYHLVKHVIEFNGIKISML